MSMSFDGAAAFVGLTTASALCGVPPSSVQNILAGSLFGLLPGTAFFMLGVVLGSVISFTCVRFLLREYLMRKMSSHAAKWRGLDLAISKEGAFFIVTLLRLSPAMPLAIANAILGVTSVGFVPYTLGTVVGLLPFSVVYVYVGSLGKEMATGGGSMLDDPLQLGLTVAGLITTIALTIKVSKVATAALDAAQAASSTKPPPLLSPEAAKAWRAASSRSPAKRTAASPKRRAASPAAKAKAKPTTPVSSALLQRAPSARLVRKRQSSAK